MTSYAASAGAFADEVGVGPAHLGEPELGGDLGGVDPVPAGGEHEQRLWDRVGVGAGGEHERVRDLRDVHPEVCRRLGGRARGTVEDDDAAGHPGRRESSAHPQNGRMLEDRI